MCGIFGIYNPAGVDPEELSRMSSALIHRGPDDEGSYIDQSIAIGNRRLSIIDLPGGRQPICSEDRTIWVSFNGEIYNYPILREELIRKGHIFQTHSDTEVIVHLYEEMGERLFERLTGMFAIAIWDAREKKLILARDRIGQKPVFYTQDGDKFIFASELKAILAADSTNFDIDFESIHHYLSLRFIPSPRTMFRQIKKLPPAHILVFREGEIKISQYWDFSFLSKVEITESEYLDRLRQRLIQTIESHSISDVPIGAFLSGGLDSSIIVAILAKDLGQSLKTFSIGVEEKDFDELPYARLVAERYHTSQIECYVDAHTAVQKLPDIVWHLDEPSDTIASCVFHAADLASRHVKVVMGGDGGDEIFAGFDRYAALQYISAYTLIPSLFRNRLIGPVLNRIPDNFAYKNSTQKLRWTHQLSFYPSIGERYAEATSFFRFNHLEKQALFSEALWEEVGHLNSSNIIIESFMNAPAEDLLDKMLYADLKTRLPEHSLMLTDRMTMAFGLEARSPFLDHELVEFQATIKSAMKIRGRRTKHLLRKLSRNYLPEQIVSREKQGFMFPMAYWFRKELSPFVKNFLVESHLVREGFIRQKTIARLIQEHLENRVDHHIRLWMLINLELWYQIYIKNHSLASLRDNIRICLEMPNHKSIT
jgi:asparagine synthase (glutamine-hydrolysing)